jgi:hypothetical protein
MVRVHVRVDDVRDAHALAFGERLIAVDIVSSWSDDRALAQRASADQIGRASEVVVVEASDNHGFLARIETLLTPHLVVAFCARAEMNRYSVLSSTRSTRGPALSIAVR